jgi:hypothetical protein
MHGNRYLPEKYFLDVSAASNGSMPQTLFAKETLPVCKLARCEAMDSASVNAIHTVAAASPLTFPYINHFRDTRALLGQSSTPIVKVTRGLTPISLGFHIAHPQNVPG